MATQYAPPSDAMQRRMNAVERIRPATKQVALFRVGSFYECYAEHAHAVIALFRELKRTPFHHLSTRDGIAMSGCLVYVVHTFVAILQTEGFTVHVAEDGFKLKPAAQWLAEEYA